MHQGSYLSGYFGHSAHEIESWLPFTGLLSIEGREYEDYNMFLTLEPAEEYTGAVVYEVPYRSDGGERPQLTFVVRGIGRWV